MFLNQLFDSQQYVHSFIDKTLNCLIITVTVTVIVTVTVTVTGIHTFHTFHTF